MKHIDDLLEKYFDGLTTLEEEKALRSYFNSDGIADRHIDYIPVFVFFNQDYAPVQRKKNPKSLYLKLAAIAAAIAVIISFSVSYLMNEKSDNTFKTVVYVDGKKMSDREIVSIQVLSSINEISDMDEQLLDSQVDILDSFIE
jgi:hypothetical protein